MSLPGPWPAGALEPMDAKIIYRKTAQGEEALRDRAQLKDGRLRAVLILVDGHSSTADLLLKLGRKNRPDDRFAQLEGLGLIEPVPQSSRAKSRRRTETSATGTAAPANETPPDDAPATEPPSRPFPAIAAAVQEVVPDPTLQADSGREAVAEQVAGIDTWVPQPAPEPEAVAAEQASGVETTPPAATVEPPVPALEPAPESLSPPPEALPAVPEDPIRPQPAASETGKEFDESPLGIASEAPPPDEPGATADVPGAPAIAISEPSLPPPDALDNDFSRPQGIAAPAPRPSWFARLRAALPRPKRRKATTESRLRPASRRGPRPLALLLLLALALLGAGAMLPGYLRPEIEHWLSERLGQPVSVGTVGIAVEPGIGLRLEDATIGTTRLAHAARVVASPSVRGLGGLIRPSIVLHVSDLTLKGEAIGALCAVPAIDAARLRASRIDAINVEGLTLSLPRATLTGLVASIGLDAETGKARVSVNDEGGRLRADLAPAARGCRFAVSGSGWHPPQLPRVTLDGLKASGTTDEKSLRLERFDARVSDGLMSGTGSLTWEPQAMLDLRLELQHLDLAKLLAALGIPPSASGELDAKLHLTSSAAQLNQLPSALGGGGPITVSRGAMDRFDLVEAARNPGADRIHGGTLRFEELSVYFHIDRGNAALRNLRLSAGALRADGMLSVKRDAALGGILNAHIKGAAGEILVPLQVAGTVAAPELAAAAEAPATHGSARPKQ